MANEWPTHDSIQEYVRQAHRARSIYLADLLSSLSYSAGGVFKRPLAFGATVLAVLIGGVFVQADTGTPSATRSFAAVCAAREASFPTPAENRDDRNLTAALAQAGLKLMAARNQCYEG